MPREHFLTQVAITWARLQASHCIPPDDQEPQQCGNLIEIDGDVGGEINGREVLSGPDKWSSTTILAGSRGPSQACERAIFRAMEPNEGGPIT